MLAPSLRKNSEEVDNVANRIRSNSNEINDIACPKSPRQITIRLENAD